MAIEFVDRITRRVNSATETSSLTGPASIQVGDILLVTINRNTAQTISSGGTSGWTVLLGGESSPGLTHILYKFADEAGAQDIAFTFNAASGYTMGLNVFRGVSTVATTNISQSGGAVTGQTSLTFSTPSTTLPGCMIVWVLSHQANTSGTSAALSRGTLGAGDTSQTSHLTAYELQASAGAIPTQVGSFAFGSSGNLQGWIIALKPDEPPSAPSGISLSPLPIDTGGTLSFTRGIDPESADVFTEVQFSTDNAASFNPLQTSAANASSIPLNTSGIPAGTQTWLRLRSEANGLYSAWVNYGPFTVVHAPSAAVIRAPLAGLTRVIGRPYLHEWDASFDPDTPASGITYRLEMSTAGNIEATFTLIAVTAAGVTSHSFDFAGKPPGSNNYFRVRGSDGVNSGPWAVSGPFNLVSDSSPGAPLALSPSSGAFDRAGALTLAWLFNDPGDDQSAYEARWGTNGTTFPNSTGKLTSTALFHTFAAGTFSAQLGNVFFQVRTWDGGDTPGPYAQVTLIAAVRPTVTITSPTSGGTVGDAQPTVTWTSTNQASYELIITTSADVQLWTSGIVTSAALARQIGISLQNGVSYKAKLIVRDSNGLASVQAVHAFTVVFTEPAAPTATATAQDSLGLNLIEIEAPAPTGGQPALSHFDLKRFIVSEGSGTAIKINQEPITAVSNAGSYPDRTAAHGIEYGYIPVAVAVNGRIALGSAVAATLHLRRLWLFAIDRPEEMFAVIATSISDGRDHAGAIVEVDGSEDPVAFFMERTIQTIRYTVRAPKGSIEWQNIKALFSRRKTVWARDGVGNSRPCAWFNFNADMLPGSVEIQMPLTKVRYSEEVLD